SMQRRGYRSLNSLEDDVDRGAPPVRSAETARGEVVAVVQALARRPAQLRASVDPVRQGRHRFRGDDHQSILARRLPQGYRRFPGRDGPQSPGLADNVTTRGPHTRGTDRRTRPGG